MNSSKNINILLENSFRAQDVDDLDQLNKISSLKPKGVSKTKMLLVTLSTTVMMALKKPLPKEYYQWTRTYLETIRNDDGTSLPNINAMLKYINEFENENKIEDELQNSKIELPEDEIIEAEVEEVHEEYEVDDQPAANSTQLPINEPKSDDEEKNDENIQSDNDK
ncbi:hypothetical protein PVAND_005825 [Polypedilum vanderplanki]|uniref:Uncharacterized protein n=1 Tax=Polypedilum vanderplanki TaxID=319348 RepID=A0A9J6C193_POLVA|nr:hypothetical protein PVAND_005825 [Polypedilum vanderplanki]